jgi:hypothetical protein
MTRARGRRATLRGSVIEHLEARGLLSALAAVASTHLEVADAARGTTLVGSSTAGRPTDRSTSTSTNSLDEGSNSQGVARADDGEGVASSADTRDDADASGAVRTSTSEDGPTREIGEPGSSATRSRDSVSSIIPTDDAPATEPESASGLVGAAPDAAAAGALIGWAPGVTAPSIVSLISSPGMVLGSDGRPPGVRGVFPETTALGALVTGQESIGLALMDPQMGPDHQVNGHSQFAPWLAAAGLAGGGSSWDDLLEGALQPGWEALDGEFRQFLLRLRGMADARDALAVGPSWPLWIGTAAAVVLSHEALLGPRRLFRRKLAEALWASTRRRVPAGPWPLDSP